MTGAEQSVKLEIGQDVLGCYWVWNLEAAFCSRRKWSVHGFPLQGLRSIVSRLLIYIRQLFGADEAVLVVYQRPVPVQRVHEQHVLR